MSLTGYNGLSDLLFLVDKCDYRAARIDHAIFQFDLGMGRGLLRVASNGLDELPAINAADLTEPINSRVFEGFAEEVRCPWMAGSGGAGRIPPSGPEVEGRCRPGEPPLAVCCYITADTARTPIYGRWPDGARTARIRTLPIRAPPRNTP